MKPLSVADDIVPLGEFKAHASRLLDQVAERRQALVITRNGRPAGVLLSPAEFDRMVERERLMQSVARGQADAEAGGGMSTEEAGAGLERCRRAQTSERAAGDPISHVADEHRVSEDEVRVAAAWSLVDELVRAHRDEIVAVAARHGTGRVRVFGSMARGDTSPESDVDLLVQVVGETTPWFPGGLVADLEELLGRRVQVITERGLRPALRDHVLAEAVEL